MLDDFSVWRGPLARLQDTDVVTLVGASEKSGATRLVVESLRRESFPFAGRINVVSRSADTVFGLPAVSSVAEIEGDPGLVWLFVRGDTVMDVLAEFRTLPRGVVVYAGGFREAGNEAGEVELRAWAETNGVPVFGPQSIGIGLFHQRVNVLDHVIKYPIIPGDVVVLAQSGGMCNTTVAALLHEGIGIHSAYALGNAAVLDFADVGLGLLDDPLVRVFALYVESIRSVAQFATFAAEASRRGKPIVLLLAGLSELGRVVAASHTGAIASPRFLVEGIAAQFGVTVVRNFDQLLAAVRTLAARDYRPTPGPRIGVFSNSGGTLVMLSDILDAEGIPLPQVSPETRLALHGENSTAASNPYDAAGGLLGNRGEFTRRVSTFAGDPNFDIVVHVVAQTPDSGHPEHIFRMCEFVEQCERLGKVPVTCVIFDEYADRCAFDDDPTICFGVEALVTRLRTLARWTKATAGTDFDTAALCMPGACRMGPIEVLTGAAARAALAPAGLGWPAETTIPFNDPGEAALAGLDYPSVAKAEASLAHRAASGAVITGIPDAEAAEAVLRFLRRKFASDVTFSSFVPHAAEHFVGLSRTSEGHPFVIAGPGGRLVGADLTFRLLPLAPAGVAALVAEAMPELAGRKDIVEAILRLTELMAYPAIDAIDLNPIVVDEAGRLVVLDAKVHVVRAPDETPAE